MDGRRAGCGWKWEEKWGKVVTVTFHHFLPTAKVTVTTFPDRLFPPMAV